MRSRAPASSQKCSDTPRFACSRRYAPSHKRNAGLVAGRGGCLPPLPLRGSRALFAHSASPLAPGPLPLRGSAPARPARRRFAGPIRRIAPKSGPPLGPSGRRSLAPPLCALRAPRSVLPPQSLRLRSPVVCGLPIGRPCALRPCLGSLRGARLPLGAARYAASGAAWLPPRAVARLWRASFRPAARGEAARVLRPLAVALGSALLLLCRSWVVGSPLRPSRPRRPRWGLRGARGCSSGPAGPLPPYGGRLHQDACAFPLYRGVKAKPLWGGCASLDIPGVARVPQGKYFFGGIPMNATLERLIEKAFDEESLMEAITEEIENRIDYRDLAENICDRYSREIDELLADLASAVL